MTASKPPNKNDKSLRTDRLAENLRANLRRRKQATRKTKIQTADRES